MESEERWLGDGFFPKEEEFFNLIKLDEYNDGLYPNSFGGVQMQMSLNTVLYTRSIYSVLDFLGDVGGLYSILMSLCQIIVGIPTFLFGSKLQKFLADKIFEKKYDACNQRV